MISVYVTTPTFQWQFLNISTFHMDEEDSKQVLPFLLSFKMFCQMERLQSFSSMHAWKYTQRHPVSFHLNHVPSLETLETVQLHWKQCEALRTRMVPVWANDLWPVTLTGGPLRARIASRNKDYPCCLHLIGAGIDYFFTSKSHNNGKIL